MDDIPKNAPKHCPGVSSDVAGKVSACQGCPNQSLCKSAPKEEDPAIANIQEKLKSVAHKIVILSGKGGVGKSTFAACLAYGLATDDKIQVAVMDVDICGPSIPTMMGVEGEQVHVSSSGWSPVPFPSVLVALLQYASENVSVMSMSFLVNGPDAAVIWRGPKKNGMIKQFLLDVDWGDVDYMVIDTPPGTSDEHLSVVNYLTRAKIDGAVVLTTPQEISLVDVRKELVFCQKVDLPVIGVVENMSVFNCPKCKKDSVIFPPTNGGGEKMAADFAVPFLGRIPLDPYIGRCCDEGRSIFDEAFPSPATAALKSITDKVKDYCWKAGQGGR